MAKIIKSLCHMCGSSYGGCGIDVFVENNKELHTISKSFKDTTNNKMELLEFVKL